VREAWTAVYADSEDVATGNRSADKAFDLQESTYCGTVEGAKFPHHLVLDLGGKRTLSAIQYLPRMETGAPGSIGRFRIYVSDTPFPM